MVNNMVKAAEGWEPKKNRGVMKKLIFLVGILVGQNSLANEEDKKTALDDYVPVVGRVGSINFSFLVNLYDDDQDGVEDEDDIKLLDHFTDTFFFYWLLTERGGLRESQTFEDRIAMFLRIPKVKKSDYLHRKLMYPLMEIPKSDDYKFERILFSRPTYIIKDKVQYQNDVKEFNSFLVGLSKDLEGRRKKALKEINKELEEK